MSSINLKKTLLASQIAVLLSGAVSVSAMAQDADTEQAETMETIEVRGIRASQQASLNEKRFSDAVVDAVTAEDIGQFPDGDIGESLARIPGISVNRQFGQGQQVSIRGASNQLTRTLLNGHAVASTGWYDQQAIDRSFNYSLLPPEVIGSIEVYKSSQANLPEGGIGGTVIVNTRKPLDMDQNTAFFSVKGDYGSISEEIDPELSGLYSWKNEAETFGVMGSASFTQTDYQRNGIESLLAWGEIVPTTFQQERERKSYNIALQYAPTDNLQFGLNILSLNLDADNSNTSLFLFPTQHGVNTCNSVNAAGVCTSVTHSGVAGVDKDGKVETWQAWAQSWARKASMESNTYNFDLSYEHDDFTIDGMIGNSKSEGGTELTSNYGQTIGQFEDFKGTYDATGDVIAIDIAKKHFDASDFNGPMSVAGWSLKKQPNSDEESYAQLNLTIPVELGAITSFKTGVRYADHKVKQTTENAILGDAVIREATDYYDGSVSSAAGFYLPNPNYDLMIADANAAISGYELHKPGYGTLHEKNFAMYAMADFSAEGIRGNFGLRFISTDISSDYYALDAFGNYADNLSTDKSSYSDVLPSINIAFDLTEDLILRASAAQVISRPNYSELFATSALAGFNDDVPGNEVLNQGNVALKPFKATQADLGIEWYFNPNGLIAATYYIKDVDTFSSTVQVKNQQIGIEDPRLIAQGFSRCGVGVYDCWTKSERINANGGRIEGVELQIQDAFDNGLGYSANYTFADASSPASNYPDEIGVFSDSSKHTVNLVGYYEMDDFTARLAYNWRSEYMIRELPGFYGNREHQPYGQLDLSMNYQVTDFMKVIFEVVNLTEEDSIQKGVASVPENIKDRKLNPEFYANYPAWSFEGEARYKLGLSFTF